MDTDEDEMIKFYGTQGPHGYLSNFAPWGFSDETGTYWPTVEHYFQAQKFDRDSDHYAACLTAATPAEAKRWGRSGKLRDDWEDVKEEVMLRALRWKFAFNHDLRRQLTETSKKLVENSPKDSYWGIGKRGEGKNRLGALLMQVREEMQRDDWVDSVPWTKFVEAQATGPIGHVTPGLVCLMINSRYQVVVSEQDASDAGFEKPITHLSIKRWDRGYMNDWREKQRIKNEIMGPGFEACELFPDEQRLVDTSNQYHLWVLPAGMHFPFGYFERLVIAPGESEVNPGAVQRDWDKDQRPEDAMTSEEADQKMRELGLA
jgi:ribA/ribD-fused uncharacterized protein